MRQITSCVLVLLSAAICLAAQPLKGRSESDAFEAAAALVRGVDKGSPQAPLDLDVSVAVSRDGLMSQPRPFLRLTHALGADLTGDLYLWGGSLRGSPYLRPQDVICTPPGEYSPICVARLGISEQVDWQSLLVDVFAARACSMNLTSMPPAIVSDAGDLWVRMSVAGKVETYWCNAPGGGSRAGDREATRVMDVMGKVANAALRR